MLFSTLWNSLCSLSPGMLPHAGAVSHRGSFQPRNRSTNGDPRMLQRSACLKNSHWDTVAPAAPRLWPSASAAAMSSTAARCVLLVAFILLTISGNVMVCLAVCRSRRLRRIANCFVVSLAVTDLMLGVLVLPFSATVELRSGNWSLGGVLCNIYISTDVLLCTSSILTLLAISVDRYLAISAPLTYPHRVTRLRAALVLLSIWAWSMAMSFVPIHMGWNTVDFQVQHLDWGVGDEDRDGRYCQFEWNNNYVVLYTLCSFYLPLLLMCGVYLCIFRVAREQVSVDETYSFCTVATTFCQTSKVLDGSCSSVCYNPLNFLHVATR